MSTSEAGRCCADEETRRTGKVWGASGNYNEEARKGRLAAMALHQLALVLRHIHKLAAGSPSAQRTDRQLLDDLSGRRDKAAFGPLVARHRPTVLRVCVRVPHHEQDAEDAFKVTFLV